MKKAFYIFLFGLAIIGCKKIPSSLSKEVKTESIFDLQSEYSDFKTKMTESDSLWIQIDRSICDYEGYERLLVTKQRDSLKIVSEIKEYFTSNPIWEKIYERRLPINDTTWSFGEFLLKNRDKLKMEKSRARLMISDGL